MVIPLRLATNSVRALTKPKPNTQRKPSSKPGTNSQGQPKAKPRRSKTLSARAAAALLSQQVIDQGQSLDRARDKLFEEHAADDNDRAFTQELLYGVCRWYGELDYIALELLGKPIRKKDRIVHFLLLVGLYQLRHLKSAPHAGVAETVNASKQLNKQWASKLLNACLRNYLRSPTVVNNPARASHPDWLIEKLEAHYQDEANAIFDGNNQRAPMCLRVNRCQQSRDDYLEELSQSNIPAKKDPHSIDGIILDQASPVAALPRFFDGACSVQDTAAQLAARILAPERGMRVLDACAAPGGKTAHLLELCDNSLELDALDISEVRCEQLRSTLERLNLTASVYAFDASTEDNWPSKHKQYDRILIDAPCSGTGVIRRHPDIKHHRRDSDILALQNSQHLLLESLWRKLVAGGKLLYASCSILPQENEHQIERFVAGKNDVILKTIHHPTGRRRKFGYQTLPSIDDMDGFYYCLLEKSE